MFIVFGNMEITSNLNKKRYLKGRTHRFYLKIISWVLASVIGWMIVHSTRKRILEKEKVSRRMMKNYDF